MAVFCEANGIVHMMSPNNEEYTLCGDAWDIGSEEECDDLVKSNIKVVNCPQCSAVIKACKGVRCNG